MGRNSVTTLYVPTLTTSELAGLREDARQLTRPWRRSSVARVRVGWDHNRNPIMIERQMHFDEAPLLEQLRAAAAGALPPHASMKRIGRGKGGEGSVTFSPPPPGWNVDASSRLTQIYKGVAGWAVRLDLHIFRSDGERYAAAIRQAVGRAPTLDAVVGQQLADDMRDWWRWCVVQVGLPASDLLQQRRTGS